MEVISSTNNTLQVVTLENGGKSTYSGAYEEPGNRVGDLTAQGDTNIQTLVNGLSGTKKIPASDASRATDQDINGATAAQNNGYAFTDVQVINGAAFTGNLTLNAILTQDVVGKYLNLKDQEGKLASADNKTFDYDLGAGNDKFDLAISSANLAYKGTATREDFVLDIDGNGGNDTISTAIYSGTPNGSNTATADGLSLASANNGNAVWYVNSKLNANLTIDAGAGDDLVNTFGSGDWTVTLGAGSDTYYADNTGHTRADSTAGTAGSTGRTTWVFNTADQTTPNNVVAERQLNDLESDADDDYIAATLAGPGSGAASLYGLELRVTFTDVNADTFTSGTIKVPTGDNKYVVTDLNINQAIKEAINSDAVLSKLLVAEDGPANTLVVRALSDGAHIDTDLAVQFRIPTTAAVTSGDVAAWQKAVGATGSWNATQANAAIQTAFSALTGNASDTAWTTGDDDYASALANDGNNRVISGQDSTHVSDNHIDSGAGNDVIVLSTGFNSNDTIVYKGTGNGFDTIVNFVDDDSPSPAATVKAVFTVDLEGAEANITTATGTYYTLNVGGATLTANTVVATGTGIIADTFAVLFNGSSVTVGGVTWDVAAAAGNSVLTFTQTTATTMPPAIPTVVSTLGLSIPANGTINDQPTNPAPTVTNIGGTQGDPGTDYLDFSSYGVVAVYLDNTATHNADGTVNTTTAELTISATADGSAAALDNGANGGGDTYIVLKQVSAATDNTIYEITWWQDQTGNTTTPGIGVADIYGANADRSLGIIGTVDFGSDLDTTWFAAANMVLL